MASFDVEINGANVIEESERSGKARSLFWPWAGANVSLLALSYGAFFLGFGVSFRQATIAAFIGTIGSFLLVGISSLAGKRSNAPTMVLYRASFGGRVSLFPLLHWLLELSLLALVGLIATSHYYWDSPWLRL
jgi:NCS1 family nucleobase:cation symporter-1